MVLGKEGNPPSQTLNPTEETNEANNEAREWARISRRQDSIRRRQGLGVFIRQVVRSRLDHRKWLAVGLGGMPHNIASRHVDR